ncbi:pantoate--beta-alanine ligase [Sphingorhabdus lutea]|uniref:Pantothenate synthetase n=1 Tax=Sphingorhabdus lutea TaxID=1913578 RepID=A0A1L3J9T3_9SPHN|nr:pantoate--beta-alanine ligase [Sphingorhabdus lutea]APG61843.1 pantoate--beta-alanine ligase [Sphingorhabdus lutea]
MQIVETLDLLRSAVGDLEPDNKLALPKLALVPTMGALHEGHLTLVREAKKMAQNVAVSIFVNPTQFGPNEDLDAYPRPRDNDIALLKKEGVDILWAPRVEEVYRKGWATRVKMTGLSDEHDGAARPGHFDGVALIVAKLFNQVQPNIALFGEKDFQQLAVIRRMAIDLDFNIEIIGVPTVRDADGLALSSRNTYLSKDERANAPALYAALQQLRTDILSGANIAKAIEKAKLSVKSSGFGAIDYISVIDAMTLHHLNIKQDAPMRIIAAAFMGKTRLIDNIGV